VICLPDTLADYLWRISELAPSQFPDDEGKDGSRNVGFLALRTPDAPTSPRRFYWILSPWNLLSTVTRHVFGRKSKSVGLIPSRFHSLLVPLLCICHWRSLPHILSYCYFYQWYHHIFGLTLWRLLLIDYFDPLIWQFSPSCFIYFLRFLSYKVINGPEVNVATFWDIIPY